MFPFRKIKAGVLSTVVVVSVLMLLVVMALLALWDADFLLFSRVNRLRIERDHIESALRVYCNDPGIITLPDADSTLLLYDSLPSSRMKFTRKPWGLYEVVGIGSPDGKSRRQVICGLRAPFDPECTLWYRNDQGTVTLTGKSHVEGQVLLPDNGIMYGQMQSVFFEGERIDPQNIGKSKEEMPEPLAAAPQHIEHLFDLSSTQEEAFPDSVAFSFREEEPLVITVGNILLEGCRLSGNIVLRGGEVEIDASCELNDIIVAADKIVVRDGFRGSCQLLGRDSVITGSNVTLEYPSGIYSQRYAGLDDGSEVNGYMIVDHTGETEIMEANCRKSRLSRVRGLFYCRGLSQIQGIISGTAYIDQAIYYSPQGYYQNLLYDVALLGNEDIAYPLWLRDDLKRKEIKWLH